MGRSRYPRYGHRIAPAALSDLLQAPVPAKCLDNASDVGQLRLCDLDESVWDRFDEKTCRVLAGEVLSALGRAARMPMPVADRRLPPLPQGMTLADLELEVRTVNCLVAAGLHERPQDLRAITIEQILTLRGFWVKCLVDLLTSLEYVNDHPAARRALRGRGSAALKAARPVGHYPRAGCRVAPQALREVLTDPLPNELVAGTRLEGRRLCDVDESIWDVLPPKRIGEVAELVVSRINVSGYSQAIQQRRLPTPPRGTRLEDLRLENRTYNCLRREGFDRRPEDLGKQTVGDLLQIKAFGAKCLVDLLSSLETLAAHEGKLDENLAAEVRSLAATADLGKIHFRDPRLGGLLRATDTQANNVAELVTQIGKRRLDVPDPLRLYKQVVEVHRKIREVTNLSLEEELIDIFTPATSPRDRTIVAEYYGWDGGGGHTLEELGRKYGLSRERIRQVCVRAVKRHRRVEVFAPALDRALEFIALRVPAQADTLAAEFHATGITRGKLSLEAVRQAAGFLSRQAPFTVVALGDTRLAVGPDDTDLPRTIVQVAKRAVLSYGATTLGEVGSELAAQEGRKVDPKLVQVTLEALQDFSWLDRRRGWFQLEALPQYGLPNMIEKILAVTGRIEISKLREAISRYRRSGRKVPPVRVLLEFCRQMPGIAVEGNTIAADPPRDWRDVLAGVEAGMVRVLKEHGPVMERGAFEEHCIAGGMNRFSFNAIIMCSPVIAQYGRSVYGLLGAKVDRKTLRALTRRRQSGSPVRVLRDYGTTRDGQVYLAYQLSKAAISGGVITVPAVMKDKIHGKFSIRTADGEEAGTLVSKNGCAWGLGPVLRGHNATPGDHLLILLDRQVREALVQIGDQRVLDGVADLENSTA